MRILMTLSMLALAISFTGCKHAEEKPDDTAAATEEAPPPAEEEVKAPAGGPLFQK